MKIMYMELQYLLYEKIKSCQIIPVILRNLYTYRNSCNKTQLFQYQQTRAIDICSDDIHHIY